MSISSRVRGDLELELDSSSNCLLSELILGYSSRSVLESLPGQSITALNVDLDGLSTERTLGMSLDFAADCFVLKATGSAG